MAEWSARALMRERLVATAKTDPRVVGVRDYGSGGQGRLDEWSDLDVEIFVRDADFERFWSGWHDWVAELGDLLFGYIGYVGHPWAMYEAEPRPLRVDFDFHPESDIEKIAGWLGTPARVEAMVLYDASSGRLRAAVARKIGERDLPEDESAEFAKRVGDFWYFILFCGDRLARGDFWSARLIYHSQALRALVLLLRLEAGAVDRWQGGHAADGLEASLSRQRLLQLEGCTPGDGAGGLRLALAAAAQLGREVSRSIGESRGWASPRRLADRVVEVTARASRR